MRTLKEKSDGRLSSPCLKAGAPRRQDMVDLDGLVHVIMPMADKEL